VLRAEFDHTLREAQVGNDAAFVRLWRDANPMLTRYLRVAGVSDPRESARYAWTGVIRELSSFSGDEIAWRAWLLGLARACVDEDAASRGRGARAHRLSRAGGHRGGGDDRSAVAQVEPAELRGVNDTIAAIRDLPLGQGEILMLRLLGELPVATVADLIGTDVVAVHRSEDRAVERLGAERELLAWSLAAPALPEELADQRIVLTAFRSGSVSSPAAATTRVLAVLPGPSLRQPPTGKPQARTSPTVVRSRLAVLGIAAISASAMSAGALSAAAYVGVLPPGLQQVMHDAIGAPAAPVPTHSGSSPSGQPSSGSVAPPTAPAAGAGGALPSATPRRAGAGTPPSRDTGPHRTPGVGTPSAKGQAAKTPTANTPSAKTPSGTTPTTRSASSKAPTRTRKPTGSGSRTPPVANPTAGVTSPARGQATSAHPATPAASQRVSPTTSQTGGQSSATGATSPARP
jgi:DNA-directed RNA polymerase specialized sigma24 family protein